MTAQSRRANHVDYSQWVTRSESLSTAVFDQRRVWAIVDLGAFYDLSTIKIWNLQWDNPPGTPRPFE